MDARGSRPLIRVGSKPKLTSIRDILREMDEEEEDDRKQSAPPTDSIPGRVRSAQRGSHGPQRGAISRPAMRRQPEVTSADKQEMTSTDTQDMTSTDKHKVTSIEKLETTSTTPLHRDKSSRHPDPEEPPLDTDEEGHPLFPWLPLASSTGSEQLTFAPKLMSERGSASFHSVMDEMKQELTKKRQKVAGFKKAIRMSVRLQNLGAARSLLRQQQEAESGIPEVAEEEEEEEEEEGDQKPKSFSSMARGWKVLNLHLKDKQLARKKTEVCGGWAMLSKALCHLTNEEQARQELYRRYLQKPNSWADGLVNYPKFLEERQGANEGTSSKPRPRTAHPCSAKHSTLLSKRPRSGFV